MRLLKPGYLRWSCRMWWDGLYLKNNFLSWTSLSINIAQRTVELMFFIWDYYMWINYKINYIWLIRCVLASLQCNPFGCSVLSAMLQKPQLTAFCLLATHKKAILLLFTLYHHAVAMSVSLIDYSACKAKASLHFTEEHLVTWLYILVLIFFILLGIFCF